jgi:hypothetical protein
VIIGKLSFALAHLLFVTVGSIILLPVMHFPPVLRAGLVLGSAILAGGTVIFLLLQKHGKLGAFVRWLIARNVFAKALRTIVQSVERVDDALKAFYREQPWDLAKSVFWHLLGYVVGIFATWYFLFLLAEDRALIVAARIWCLVLWFDLVTFAVPMNMGVLEGGRLVAFRLFGFGALPGMTFGIVSRVAQLFWAGFGLINYALLISGLRYRTRPSDASAKFSQQQPFEA